MIEKDFLNNATEFTKSIITENKNKTSDKILRYNWREIATTIIVSYPFALKARSEEARSHYWRLAGNKDLLEVFNIIAKTLVYLHIAIGISKKEKDFLKRKFKPIVKNLFNSFLVDYIKYDIDWDLWLDDLMNHIRLPITLKNFFDYDFPNWTWFEKITQGYRASIINIDTATKIDYFYSNYLPPIFIINNVFSSDNCSQKKFDDLKVLIDAVGDPGYYFSLLLEIENLSDTYYKGLLNLLKEKDKRFLRIGLGAEISHAEFPDLSFKPAKLKTILEKYLKERKIPSNNIKFDSFSIIDIDEDTKLLIEFLQTGSKKILEKIKSRGREIRNREKEISNDNFLNTNFKYLSPSEIQIYFQRYFNHVSKVLNLESSIILNKLVDLDIKEEIQKRFRFDKRLLLARIIEHPKLNKLISPGTRHFNGYKTFFKPAADRTFEQLIDIFLAFERYLPKYKARELIFTVLTRIYDYSPISYIILRSFNLLE